MDNKIETSSEDKENDYSSNELKEIKKEEAVDVEVIDDDDDNMINIGIIKDYNDLYGDN